jgi:hypothetical protein
MIKQSPNEYINEFLYFVLRQGTGSKPKDSFIYCSGVNIDRFMPITKGRHRPMSNPAIRGLQLVNLGVRDLALTKGAVPIALRGNECAGIVPSKDQWYKELLLIEKVPDSFPSEIINYCVINLLKKIVNSCLLSVKPPETVFIPEELQAYIENLCKEFGM